MAEMNFQNKILVDKEAINDKVREIAGKISKDYEGEEIVLIGVLKGSFVFLSDLIRYITVPVEIDFISVSSYGSGTESTGTVKINKDSNINFEGKNIILVEDIIDTGLTLSHLVDLFLCRKPKSLKTTSIFDKKERRKIDIIADYEGIVIPDEFVVGYGMDCNEKHRELPDLRY